MILCISLYKQTHRRMQLIRGLQNLKSHHHGYVVTIGNFDGVHQGHRILLEKLICKGKRHGLPTLVIIFEPQPNEYFYKDKVPPRLMRLREKLMRFQQVGIDQVLCIRFNQEFAKLSAQEFIEKILVEKLGAKYVLIGDDFHFGHQRIGNIELLRKHGQQYHFAAEAMPTFMLAGERVSSSQVRKALWEGNLDHAKILLGQPYGIAGKVAHGDKRGRIIGFPTANIYLHRKAVPVHGVYAVKIYGLNDKCLFGVANVGTRPTVGGTRSLLEVHIFDFNETIYRRHVFIELVHKLRDEKRFENFDLLKQQIFKDAVEAKAFFRDASY